MKPLSSPETTDSNSVLYKAKATGASWDVLLSSWVLKSHKLILREPSKMLLVSFSKISDVKISSGL